MRPTLLLLAALICSAPIGAAPKQYHLVADFRKSQLVVQSDYKMCLPDTNGVVLSGSYIWSCLSSVKPGVDRVLAFVAFEEGLSFTGQKKTFPYQLVLEIDRDNRVCGGFALMPFWAEPFGDELVGCIATGRVFSDGMILDSGMFHVPLRDAKPTIDYAGVLHL